MMFSYGQKVAVRAKNNRTEYIYPHMGMVLQETDTDVVLLFPDGRVTVKKADLA
ncbi:MAG: hypothetical protein H0Z34_09125 [Brevibacillus sp.]|nr:hypothetical protein [Brevibacillus sp.]